MELIIPNRTIKNPANTRPRPKALIEFIKDMQFYIAVHLSK